MILSLHEKNLLIGRLPELELSYDNILHRKVYADIFIIIPKGKKSLMWFTYWKGQNVCFTLTLNERGNICDISAQPVCFGSDLSLSTLLYGTLIDVDGLKHFTCENIYYYKGHYVGHYNFGKKLSLFRELFIYYIRQVAYTEQFIIIGLPVMKTEFQEAVNCAAELPYSTYGIQMYYLQDKTNISKGIYLLKQTTTHEAYFMVKATLQNDIYNLYGTSGIVLGIAMIPSYKNSVMMNSLFRTIKENANLDLLEESDEEEEFENNSESKFVDLNKSIIMKCVFNKRFRKWQPIEVYKGKDKVKLITFQEAQLIDR